MHFSVLTSTSNKMEALKGSLIPSLQIPSTPTTLHKTQFLNFQFCPIPTSFLKSIQRNTSRSKLLSRSKLFATSSSSTASTEPIDPTDPLLETDSQEEKFDWFSQWYPVMPVRDLDKRVPHAKKVIGFDVVVWWDRNEGSWKVFDDTCPHRLAPLSEGRIDQWGRLQCVYHGWCFNGSGDCKFIPQAPPDGPPVHTFKKACVAAYPCTVQNGILWFWPNSNPEYKDILSKKKPPYIPELDDPSYVKPMANRDFPFGYEILIENLMDPSHVPYAHFKLLPNPPSKNRVKLDREGGAPIDISIEKLDKNGFQATRYGGNSRFMAPCTYYSAVSLTSVNPGNVSDQGNGSVSSAGNNMPSSNSNVPQQRGLLVFYCVPVSPGRSRLILIFPRNFGVWIDKIIPRWVFHVRLNLVLDSDLYLLHIEERKIMDAGSSNWQKACFVPTKSDAQVVAFRKWLKKYSDGQINWGEMFSGLPPSTPKEQLMDRYWSHVVNCSSCRVAYKGLNALEVVLQVVSIVSIGIVAATKQTGMSAVARTTLVLMAVLCFAASRWLAHFIYKNFHFHDYNHALL
ncbi:protochlorophyllide-dependent translocon component 52, chloroplastic isoform X2 [Hevea brasiliensis]|uniref:protochlorophyllide-dependent translocon component 52, chloroplastic isoform X2 n=1 Tax=Hevea brasiliensis TaxID=3981 RepID=UPI0025DE7C4D|nr:protochlorophyllide-dependent translocon component 52, chloroplastic isoform X2 [Hevea brasiliensis]